MRGNTPLRQERREDFKCQKEGENVESLRNLTCKCTQKKRRKFENRFFYEIFKKIFIINLTKTKRMTELDLKNLRKELMKFYETNLRKENSTQMK